MSCVRRHASANETASWSASVEALAGEAPCPLGSATQRTAKAPAMTMVSKAVFIGASRGAGCVGGAFQIMAAQRASGVFCCTNGEQEGGGSNGRSVSAAESLALHYRPFMNRIDWKEEDTATHLTPAFAVDQGTLPWFCLCASLALCLSERLNSNSLRLHARLRCRDASSHSSFSRTM